MIAAYGSALSGPMLVQSALNTKGIEMDTELLLDLPEIEVDEIEVEYLTDSDYDSDPADCVVIHWDK